jgi:(p)ppGpp synthase/HD superfamily hydrolase
LAGDPLPETCVPYITHLMGSMCILARLGVRDEVLAAALLHDYLEDVPDPDGRQTIRRAVGPEVLDLVLEVTEDKRDDVADSETWEIRKREQVARIDAMSDDAVLIKAADMLHNVQTLLTDLDATDRTTAVWERLNAGPDRQLWYFTAVLDAAERRLGGHPLVRELSRAVDTLEHLV